MKELKIFAIVVALSGVLYWGIEPYAHHELHPHTAAANYDFEAEDLALGAKNLEAAKAKLEKAQASGDEQKINDATDAVAKAQQQLNEYTEFWKDIKSIKIAKGDAQKGAELFPNAGCAGCHSLKSAGFEAPMSAAESSESFGVVPPDLSTAGAIYDEYFLAALIKNPPMALKLAHKFNDDRPYPMSAFFGVEGDVNEEVAHIVAYLKSVASDYAKQNNGVSDEVLFADACQRCHDVKYDGKYAISNRVSLANYMGSNPPDLSMMIRAKNADNYLNKLINDPQKMLPGTSMPRVGLTKESEEQIVTYLQKVGDSKKQERENLGIYIMIYFLILGVFATLWKNKIWKELH